VVTEVLNPRQDLVLVAGPKPSAVSYPSGRKRVSVWSDLTRMLTPEACIGVFGLLGRTASGNPPLNGTRRGHLHTESLKSECHASEVDCNAVRLVEEIQAEVAVIPLGVDSHLL
jgi:hypothetical protein